MGEGWETMRERETGLRQQWRGWKGEDRFKEKDQIERIWSIQILCPVTYSVSWLEGGGKVVVTSGEWMRARAKNDTTTSPCMAGVGTERGKAGVGTDAGEQRELCRSVLTLNGSPAFWGCHLEAVTICLEDVGGAQLSAFSGSHIAEVVTEREGSGAVLKKKAEPIYGQLTFEKSSKTFNGEKTVFQQRVLGKLDIQFYDWM